MNIKKELLEPFPVLETERLRLRNLRPGDLESVYACVTHPQVKKHAAFKSRTLLFPERFYRYLQDSYEHLRDLHFIIEWVESGECIGLCSLQCWDPAAGNARIGYLLEPSWWDKGIGTEAVSEVTRFGFERLGLKYIEACCGATNLASRRVLEKCGYEHRGSVGAFVTQMKYICDGTLTVRG